MIVSIFKNRYHETANYMLVDKVLEAIRTGGKIKPLIADIRAEKDKNVRTDLKAKLPAIRFSGKFATNTDDSLIEHSNLAILDFDHIDKLKEKRDELMALPYIYSVFTSPSGDGIKALAVIKDGKRHREHYTALMQDIRGLDPKNINVSRICYASYDPDIYVNKNAIAYDKVAETSVISQQVAVTESNEIFTKLEKWLAKRSDTFTTGNRNAYIYKLAAACCRAGVDKHDAYFLIRSNYLIGNTDFKANEMQSAIESAYRKNEFGTAKFEETEFVEKTGNAVVLADSIEDIADIVLGMSVISGALDIYDNGFKTAEPTGIDEVDYLFKWKQGELTCFTGIGNYGKSTFANFLMINKSIKDGTKWAVFSPENNPADEYYHELTEIYLGADCTKSNPKKPSKQEFITAYEFISEHFFYVYPKTVAPTPEYIKELFLKLIITKKVKGVVIDPFNQMSNDYGSSGGRDDKYLETFLADCLRFAQTNGVYFLIISHPKSLHKDKGEGYPCPDVFDLAGGAMWNNKCDNILVYHRPEVHKDPQSTLCEFHSKKIRRQKSVGKRGKIDFHYDYKTRRFIFNEMPLHKKQEGEKKEFDNFVSTIKSEGYNPDAWTQSMPKGKEEDFIDEF